MKSLNQIKCTACQEGEAPLAQEEIESYLPQVPEWQVVEKDGVKHLERVYKFGSFASAMNFSFRVGEIAEEEGHHPAVLTEWGKVTVTWWTHAIKGLHQNDFIMAAKTDHLFKEVS